MNSLITENLPRQLDELLCLTETSTCLICNKGNFASSLCEMMKTNCFFHLWITAIKGRDTSLPMNRGTLLLIFGIYTWLMNPIKIRQFPSAADCSPLNSFLLNAKFCSLNARWTNIRIPESQLRKCTLRTQSTVSECNLHFQFSQWLSSSTLICFRLQRKASEIFVAFKSLP